jgi:uncharacterized protein (TIGR03118 family)
VCKTSQQFTQRGEVGMVMNRRHIVVGSGVTAVLAATGAGALVAACGGGTETVAPIVPAANSYKQLNLVANKASYSPQFLEPDFIDAWGIAIRPAGAGGHFWVGAGGTSWQYVGDVAASSTASLKTLFQDGLKEVTVPGADSLITEASIGKITGVAYNGAALTDNKFKITTQTATDPAAGNAVTFDGSARFVFVTDSGIVSGWTDRAANGSTVRVDGAAAQAYDGSAEASAFFGVAIKPTSWDAMWLADFGAAPQIVTLNATWAKVPTVGFANPFGSGAAGAVKPGDPVPFNIQVLNDGTKDRVFVAYALSQEDPNNPGSFYAAEEDAVDATAEAAGGNKPNKGRLVEFDTAGNQVRIFDDAMRLNAPWGLAIAPANFGLLSGKLLVGNFGGAGRICAFDLASGAYVDDLKDAAGQSVKIAGLWGLQFGNGVTLGDTNALYFAAGPEDEADGLFGSLRAVA